MVSSVLEHVQFFLEWQMFKQKYLRRQMLLSEAFA